MRVTVSTNDLRLALKSVVQHVYPDNEMPDLHPHRRLFPTGDVIQPLSAALHAAGFAG